MAPGLLGHICTHLAPMLTLRRLCEFVVLTLVALSASGDFPPLFNTEPDSDETRLSAEQAAAKLQLPRGFQAIAFAAEPDIQNPIAMSWDSRGRLWIAENYTYAEREQRFQLTLRDRVVILDNTRGQSFSKRTVFTDNVQMLTGLEVGHGGVWLMCPPKLIFVPDRDRDDVPDGPGQVVLDGFTVAEQNYHNFANGLRFGPDGWLYGRCGGACPGRIGIPGTPDHQRLALEGGIWRYHPTRQWIEVLTTGTTNPWGHDWNEVGDAFFVNTVNGHLWHMIPGAHFTRPSLLDPNRRTYELIDFHADHWHFDTGQSWTKSRDGAANSFGGGHAHSGAMIYQGDSWPKRYRGKLLTLNFHGQRANQEALLRHGGGYLAKHDKDFFLASDPWFRGMELSAGPDGNVFVLDWSDSGECHEHTGVHRTSGRIFKISYGQPRANSQHNTDLAAWPIDELVETHAKSNDWQVRQARLELALRARTSDQSVAVQGLRKLFASAPNDQRQTVQSMLTLHTIGGAEDGFLREQLSHTNEYVRGWAIRLLTETWTLDDANGPVLIPENRRLAIEREATALLPIFRQMATEDPSPYVRLVLASTLQRLPVEMRASLAEPLVMHIEDAGDHNIPLMLWYGLIPLAENDCASLVSVAKSCRLPTTLRLISRCLAEEIENHPRAINDLLTFAAHANESYRKIVLTGIAEGLKGWRVAVEPVAWKQIVKVNSKETNFLIRELSVVFGDGRAVEELKQIALGAREAELSVRLSALTTLIQSDTEELRTICESLLADNQMNVLAARGLSRFDDPEIGEAIVSRYHRFRGSFRPQVMSILVSRASFAGVMLEAIRAGKIPRNDLSAYQVRQIHGFGDSKLSKMVGEVWGEVRATPQAKQQSIDSIKQKLSKQTSNEANLHRGRSLFVKLCQNCHRLYGEGTLIGPDLTGSDRSNLDYLLSNVIDPSGVVDKDFRMSILLTDDDRIVTGLVTSESDRTITVQTATELLTFDKHAVQSRKVTETSPMPDGLLDTLSMDQIRDLVGYLRHPSQVSLP